MDRAAPTLPPVHQAGYMPYLDGIRAVAVLGVLVSHFVADQTWLIANAEWGRLGVDLFFVLSGFLITGILLRYRDESHSAGDIVAHLRVFYSRRALRIVPIYYLTILVGVVLGYEPMRQFLLWHLSYTTNVAIFLFPKHLLGSTAHFWSLAIEEQFYLLWPCVILLVSRRWLRYCIYAFMAIGVCSRMVPIYAGGFSLDPLVSTRFDLLGAGALLALYWHEPSTFSKERTFLLIAGVTCGLPLVALVMAKGFAPALGPMTNVLTELGAALFFMGVIDRAAQARPWRVLAPLGWRPVRYIGKISYGIYLYHPLVSLAMANLLSAVGIPPPPFGVTQLLLYGSVSVALASASWHLIEHPINRLKDRIAAPAERPQPVAL